MVKIIEVIRTEKGVINQKFPFLEIILKIELNKCPDDSKKKGCQSRDKNLH